MFGLLYVGGLSIACIIGIILYYGFMAGRIELKTSLIIFISTIIFGTIYCSLVLSKRMEIFSYYKLKKISKKNDYKVYKYTGDIQAIYISTYIEKRMSLDAYLIQSASDLIKPVTPIVEYEVKGETYETMNPILETGAELPVGTKVYVWYKKDNPKQAILGTELESHSSSKFLGMLLIAFGIMLLLLY